MNQQPVTRALVVDDSHTQALDLRNRLMRMGLEVEVANSGADALTAIARQRPDVILTDLIMPEMDGLALVQKVRADYPGIPVVLLTSHGSEEIAVAALKQGAADYVPKQHLSRDLPRSLDNVLAVARSNRVRQLMLGSLVQTEAKFVLENDPTLIPPLVGRLQDNLARMRICEENGRMRVAMALREALLNAMEHGNLEVSSELRERDDDSFYKLTKQRRGQKPYNDRRVELVARETRDAATYVIRDEGPGFDVRKLPDPTDPEQLEKASGRGLLLIRSFMDEVSHTETGQQITMVKRRENS